MKQTLTAKLKLKTTPEQCKLLRSTQLAYRDALNFASQYAFEHKKLSNNARLQKGTYPDIRTRFKLPSQMTCSVRCAEYRVKNDGSSTRLGYLGAFVFCPRAFGFGCLGKRSQSCTPATVCRIAVDARGKPSAFQRGY